MTTLGDVRGVGGATLAKLAELGITTPAELALRLPSKYIDLDLPVRAADAEPGQFCLLEGTVVGKTTPSKRGTKSFTVRLVDNTDKRAAVSKSLFSTSLITTRR